MKMEELGKLFTSLGFENVLTVIASGNVIFQTPEKDQVRLTQQIEKALLDSLGYEVKILLRNETHIHEMVKNDPFKGVTDKEIKFFVTFIAKGLDQDIKLPLKFNDEGSEIIKVTDGEVYFLRYPQGKTTEAMTFIDKMFGKYSTTRNWNTIQKIATLM